MAKLSGFQCDRCGARYEKGTCKDTQGRTDRFLIGVGLINTAQQIFRTDLCNDCMAELQAWLDDPAKYVTKSLISEEILDDEEED